MTRLWQRRSARQRVKCRHGRHYSGHIYPDRQLCREFCPHSAHIRRISGVQYPAKVYAAMHETTPFPCDRTILIGKYIDSIIIQSNKSHATIFFFHFYISF